MRRTPYLFSLIGWCLLFSACSRIPQTYTEENRFPDIFPDYAGVTVPPNIASLNFRVDENQVQSSVMVCTSGLGHQLVVRGNHIVHFPQGKWRKMLLANMGDSLSIQMYVKQAGQWKKFRPFHIHVAPDSIDSYLVYRLIDGYVLWNEMGIYQRNLENFTETTVIHNRMTEDNCMNCHSFCNNDPNTMAFHMRAKLAGTMLWQNGKFRKLDTRTEHTISAGAYPSWHPSGRYIAFSTNKTRASYHAVKDKKVEVWDGESDIVVLDVEKNMLLTDTILMSKARFETFPVWSPDGKSLFFCSADSVSMPRYYDQAKYSLMHIAFDPTTQKFGSTIDTIISTYHTGKSVSFPRLSPDGNFLLYTQSAYGNFSIWHKDADLWMFDLRNGTTRFLDEVNSPDTESFHSWSSNGRWFVFSSRRIDGLYTRPYFAWVDRSGKVHKPFLLPQKDPGYYSWLMKSYNIPELIRGPITVGPREIAEKAREAAEKIAD